MNERDLIFLKHINESIGKIDNFIYGISIDKFKKDEKTQYSIIRALEIIGEAIKNLSDETTLKYSNVPWKEYAGQRDILIHHYFGIDIEKVWRVIKEELPNLKKDIQDIIKKEKKK